MGLSPWVPSDGLPVTRFRCSLARSDERRIVGLLPFAYVFRGNRLNRPASFRTASHLADGPEPSKLAGAGLARNATRRPGRVSLTRENRRSSERTLDERKMTFFIVHLLRPLFGSGGERAGVQARTLPLTRPTPGAIDCAERGTRERVPRLG